MFILPKKFHLDEKNTFVEEETPEINFIQVNRRRRGILFEYGGFQHLYEIDTDAANGWETDCDVKLVDKRSLSEVDNMDGNQVTSDGFKLVEIIETKKGYILSLLIHIMDVDVYHWVERDLNYVIKEIFFWFESQHAIVEGGSHFLSESYRDVHMEGIRIIEENRKK